MTPLNRDEIIKGYLECVPRQHRKKYLVGLSGKSRKAAMESHCCECMGWISSDVADCTDVRCSLWSYRPKFKGRQGVSEGVVSGSRNDDLPRGRGKVPAPKIKGLEAPLEAV
jgi:hypothetical protein